MFSSGLRKLYGVVAFFVLFGNGLFSATARDARFYAVDVQVQTQLNPPALVFSWPAANYARQYTVRRKSPNDSTWGGTTTLPGDSTGFVDVSILPGIAYEYEIDLETNESSMEGTIHAFSYILGGVDVSEVERKGKVILLVESSVAGFLKTEVEQFQRDLIGDGWEILRHDVPNSAAVIDVKRLIVDDFNSDPGNVRSIILLGHIPVPYSGQIAPDMHESHRGAWPADVYYAEIDGPWTDRSVSIKSQDFSENDNFPGDGKFDQSVLPSAADLEIGRIDFWEMPAFYPRTEVDLLRNYLRKDHAFRHRSFTLPRQGLIRDNFGDLEGDAPAVDAWRHYSAFFGSGHVREPGPGQFFPALRDDGYLWAYGCGGGGNDKADGVGSTYDFAANDPKTAFLILHGSHFGDWNAPDNLLKASIATPNYTLASIWSGLPHWYMHHLGLGKTLGHSTRVTQNNRGLYRSHLNFSTGEVHVALLGDPTLQIYPVAPAADLSARDNGNMQLNWSASPDENVLGYHVFYSTLAEGPYARINSQTVTGTSFSHAVGVGTHYYMVRAVKLEKTGSGTFRNLSQGIFTTAAKSSGGISPPPMVTIALEDSEASEFRANPGTFRIIRDRVDDTPVTVSLNIGGTAQNGSDYMVLSSTVTIPAGVASAIVLISPRSDNTIEGEEVVTIEITPANGYRVGSPSGAALTIKDYVAAVPEAARIQQIQRGDGVIRIKYKTSALQRTQLEGSEDGLKWIILKQGLPSLAGEGEFEERFSLDKRCQFYRLQSLR